jgi:hypothetical protein
MIIDFKNFINEKEAISPSQYKPYGQACEEDDSIKNRYKEIFEEYKKKYSGDRNAYRLYLPLIEEKQKSETEKEITDFLKTKECDVVDYMIGQAKFRNARNPKRIGQILTGLERNASPEEKIELKRLMKAFIEDPNRKQGSASKYLVCVSRHPYDIAGADTNRKWTNCMTLVTGQNHHYLIHDVKEGSLVGYLIESSDKNIKDPIANCAIKPYISADNPSDIILVKDNKTYPQPYPDFERTITNFLNEINGEKTQGIYCLNPKLYNDNKLNNKIVNFKELTPDIIKKIAKIYKIKQRDLVINDDLSVDVKGDVDISDRMLTKMPLMFNHVYGNFSANNNQLKTLIGSPKIVDGDFLVFNNQLVDVIGSPEKVGGEYAVSDNYIKSIEGCPKEVGSHFDVSFNKNLSLLKRAKVPCVIGGKFVNRTGDNQSTADVYEHLIPYNKF